MSRRLALLLFAALLTPSAAAAIPLSLSRSSQQQVGWATGSRTMVRLTGLQTIGSSGENIRPADGGSSFALYGTSFVPDRLDQSFDYSAISNDSTTRTDSSTSTFTVYATHSSGFQATSPAPLGFFETGNSAFRSSR